VKLQIFIDCEIFDVIYSYLAIKTNYHERKHAAENL
jgi:hypothetical protein